MAQTYCNFIIRFSILQVMLIIAPFAICGTVRLVSYNLLDSNHLTHMTIIVKIHAIVDPIVVENRRQNHKWIRRCGLGAQT